MCNIMPTKSTVDNFDHYPDFNGKVIAIVLRAKRFDNFKPRVLRKRLRAHFHNFDHTFDVLANREPSRQFCVIELNGSSNLRVFNNFMLILVLTPVF